MLDRFASCKRAYKTGRDELYDSSSSRVIIIIVESCKLFSSSLSSSPLVFAFFRPSGHSLLPFRRSDLSTPPTLLLNSGSVVFTPDGKKACRDGGSPFMLWPRAYTCRIISIRLLITVILEFPHQGRRTRLPPPPESPQAFREKAANSKQASKQVGSSSSSSPVTQIPVLAAAKARLGDQGTRTILPPLLPSTPCIAAAT